MPLIGLMIQSSEVTWNAPDPQGIIMITGHNLLTDYHSITDAKIEVACVARVNPRAIQSSKTLHMCHKQLLTGDLRTTMFNQVANLLSVKDGPAFFKKLTSFTTVASLQLSVVLFNKIFNLNLLNGSFTSQLSTHISITSSS